MSGSEHALVSELCTFALSLHFLSPLRFFLWAQYYLQRTFFSLNFMVLMLAGMRFVYWQNLDEAYRAEPLVVMHQERKISRT